jgi:BirA family transcriptional regulator, biotin operon repressor / biotin---[acetyl-CoA-carboxylase] ligase
MSWDQELFQRYLATRRFGREFRHFTELDSTNQWLLQNSNIFLLSGSVIVADHQTAGRGRWNRSWMDFPEKSLLFSLLYRGKDVYEQCGWITMIPAIALAECLQIQYDIDAEIKLKWPNDMLLNGKKVAGVLGQTGSQGENVFAVVGMGINVNADAEQMSVVCTPASSLMAELNREFAREILFAQLLNEMEALFDLLIGNNFESLKKMWMKYGMAIGDATTRKEGMEVIEGSFAGLGDQGQLLIRDLYEHIHEFYSGDVR